MDKKRKRNAKRRNVTYKGYKVKQWQTEEGAAAPNWRQGHEQPQPQDAVGQRHTQPNWSNFNQNFQESQKMQKHIYCIQMIGWTPTALMKI